MVLQILLVLLFLVVIASVIMVSSVYVVRQQSVAIIERFGKYQKLSNSGIHLRAPFGIDRIAARVQLRLLQSEIVVETKTQDNVFVTMNVATQYRVNENNVTDAYYKLMRPEAQIKSYIEDALRSSVPKLTLDELFEKKDEIALEVQKQVAEEMSTYGYIIVKTLIGVDEGLISETLIDLYSKHGIVAEPAGAASVAALEVLSDYIKGKTICCIISGGNNDINRMPEMEERALIYDGIKHYFVVNFPQRPGALREFVNDILGPNDDITRFEYIKRASKGTGPVLIGVALANKHDYAGLIHRMEKFDPSYINLNGNETLYNMLV